MKPDTHPEFKEVTVRCVCGNEFVSGSTSDSIRVEICANCHPFYTGKQKLVDTAGRVERFYKKYAHLDKFAGKAAEMEAERLSKVGDEEGEGGQA